MGAWNLIACFILFVVLVNSIQAVDAESKDKPSLEFQRRIFPELRELTEEDEDVRNAFFLCTSAWHARIRQRCISAFDKPDIQRLAVRHKGFDLIPQCVWKNIFRGTCLPVLSCQGGICKCETAPTTPCNVSDVPKQNFTENCTEEINAFIPILKNQSTANGRSSVIDPGQLIQYIILMAAIVFVVATQ